MCGLLAFLFIAVPALEIYVIIQVGGWLGPWPTVGIIFATGIAGASLAKHQGLAVIRRLQASLNEMHEIGQSMAEAALVLVAGVLMLTPGFITDIVGILLLIPPVRWLIARRMVVFGRARMAEQAQGQARIYEIRPDDADGDRGNGRGNGHGRDDGPPPPGVIDV